MKHFCEHLFNPLRLGEDNLQKGGVMEIDMNVKFNVKRKFIVNGKEYGSVEEMPANIRQSYEKALESAKGKIVFNGQKYENVEAMPPDVRQMYDEMMRKLVEMRMSPDAVAEKPISFSFSKSTTPEPAISSRLLTFSIMLLIFLGILYFLYQKGHGH